MLAFFYFFKNEMLNQLSNAHKFYIKSYIDLLKFYINSYVVLLNIFYPFHLKIKASQTMKCCILHTLINSL